MKKKTKTSDMKAYQKAYRELPEVKAKKRAYGRLPKQIKKKKLYSLKPKVRKNRTEYMIAYMRKYREAHVRLPKKKVKRRYKKIIRRLFDIKRNDLAVYNEGFAKGYAQGHKKGKHDVFKRLEDFEQKLYDEIMDNYCDDKKTAAKVYDKIFTKEFKELYETNQL